MMSQVDYRIFSGTAAENYARYFVPVIPAPLAADLVETAAPRAGEYVLDVACGTGVVTRLAALRVGAAGRVVGVDLTPGMLEVARTIPLAADRVARGKRRSASAPRRIVRPGAVPARADVRRRPARCRTGDAAGAVIRRSRRHQRARADNPRIRDPGAGPDRAHQTRPWRLRAFRLLAPRPEGARRVAARGRVP